MNRKKLAIQIQKSDIDKQIEHYIRRYPSGHIYATNSKEIYPKVEVFFNGKFYDLDIRRILWALSKQYYPTKTCTFVCKCGMGDCINPNHLKLIDY